MHILHSLMVLLRDLCDFFGRNGILRPIVVVSNLHYSLDLLLEALCLLLISTHELCGL